MYYYGARYYDARVSVFLSVDAKADKFVSWSAYSYCFNNPISFVDPDGMEPTPFPRHKLGSVEYYRWRYNDFVRQNPGKTAPDYYLNYGDKYIRRFTGETYKKLSAHGKRWLIQARTNLQVAIENKLKDDPGIELRNEGSDFKEFAFDSHVDAYWDAGLYKLNTVDLVNVVLTPDLKDLVSEEGVAQATAMMERLADYWAKNPKEAAKRAGELFLNRDKIKVMIIGKAIREGVDPSRAVPIVEKILEKIPTTEL